MSAWSMLTLVGRDRPGIVAAVTRALHAGGCNLGEASMTRLGASFTVMLMVKHPGTSAALLELITPVAAEWGLHPHVDGIEGRLHERQEPDVSVQVYGSDCVGIVAEATAALAEAGLNIIELDSAVGGDPDAPLYVLHIEGCATKGYEALEEAVVALNDRHRFEVRLSPIDTVIG